MTKFLKIAFVAIAVTAVGSVATLGFMGDAHAGISLGKQKKK